MTLNGLLKVVTGKIERPIFLKEQDFEGAYHLFQSPISYAGEVEDRIQHFKSTHILIGEWQDDFMMWSAIGYLLEKQEFHSLTEIEAIELERLEREYPSI